MRDWNNILLLSSILDFGRPISERREPIGLNGKSLFQMSTHNKRLAHKSTKIAISNLLHFVVRTWFSFCKCKMWNVSYTTHTSLYFKRSLYVWLWLLLLLFYFISFFLCSHSLSVHWVSMLRFFSVSFFVHSSHLLAILSHFFFSFLSSHSHSLFLSLCVCACCWFLPRYV